MNVEEIKEGAEHAQHKGEKGIGLTMAVTAVLLAMATLLGHRAHTEEIKLQTRVNDGWSFYQAKHSRAHSYGTDAEKELVNNHRDLAARYFKVSTDEECGTPAEGGCASPVLKDSPLLQQFVKELKAATADHGAHAENAEIAVATPASNAHAGESSAKEEHANKSPHKDGAIDIQEHTRDLEKETELVTNQANFYDMAELSLEISIVLCSIALLAEMKLFWKLSFLSTAAGLGLALWGLLY